MSYLYEMREAAARKGNTFKVFEVTRCSECKGRIFYRFGDWWFDHRFGCAEGTSRVNDHC